MDLWELAAIQGIRKTLAEYAIFTDCARISDFAALFTADGEFVLPDGSSTVGPAAIRALLQGHQDYFCANPEAAPPGFLRHQITTENIEILGEKSAKSECYFMTMTAHLPDHWGRWIDSLVMESDGRWRFKRRVVLTEGWAQDSWFGTTFRRV